MVTYFQDIRRNLSVTDYDFPEVISNIQKARRIWDCLSRILVWESVDSWKLGRFYLIIAQAILLFGARPGLLPPSSGGYWGDYTTVYRPPCPPSTLIIGLWCFLPVSEARGELGSISIRISCYCYPLSKSTFLFTYPSYPVSFTSTFAAIAS